MLVFVKGLVMGGECSNARHYCLKKLKREKPIESDSIAPGIQAGRKIQVQGRGKAEYH